jgi:hypothetical protein
MTWPKAKRTPYMERGIVRKRCIRCGDKARFQWNVCADDGYRPICAECDVALNELVLCWMGDPDWKPKIARYREWVDA